MAVADVPIAPSIRESIKQGWTNMWPVFWILLGLSLVVGIAGIVGQPGTFLPAGSAWQLELGVAGLGLVFSVLFLGPLGLGVVKAHLAASRGETPSFNDLGYGFTRYPQSVLLTLMTILIVVGGFILLVIPGIFLAIKLTFSAHRFVNDEEDAMDAIKASWEDVRGRWWHTFGLAVMAIPLYVAGFLALFVGVFVADILVGQMTTVFWRSINDQVVD